MRITIIQDDGVVGVDGTFRQIDLGELDPAIRVVQFDTVAGVGHIEFDRGATIDVEVRDEAAERVLERLALEALAPIFKRDADGRELEERDLEAEARAEREALGRLQPLMKLVPVPRANEALTAETFAPFQRFVDAWQAWTPPAPPVPSAEEIAAREREQKRAAALRALDDERLAQALLDPAAPQEVKDYAAVLEVVELPLEGAG